MNRKQKKEQRRLQSTRQLMGIDQLTGHGMTTARGELVFFLVQPDNLSILSDEGIRCRVMALTDLLRLHDGVCLLALDSRESFQPNKHYYQERLAGEELPALRELLRQDMAHLDEIQSTTATAREFAIVLRREKRAEDTTDTPLRELEKSIRNMGFRVRLADGQDIKRLLAVYYQQDMTTEYFEDVDGEGWVMARG